MFTNLINICLQYNKSKLMKKIEQKKNGQKKKIQKKKKVGEYCVFLDRPLGGGKFGTVCQGLNQKTGEWVAIKMIPRTKVHDKNQQYMINALKRQTLILYKLSSENVVAFKDIIATKNSYYIIQQLCNGDLKGYLTKHPKVPEKKAIQFMTMILNGFYALIVINVIHRDIKPENILMKDGVLKIADFGLSRRVNGDQLMVSAVGTKSYSSPQIISSSKYTSKADIWSLGIVFYQMLYGSVPFKNLNLNNIKEECSDFQFPKNPQVSQETQQIIRKCLQYNEDTRADWSYLFSHPFFEKNVPSLQKLNFRLNYIISVIRKQIDQRNIDLQKFFKRFGFHKNTEINYKQYEYMITHLISIDKITKKQIQYSFNAFDEDKSDRISFEQFKKALQCRGVTMKSATRQQISNLFIPFVKNEDQQGNMQIDGQSFTPQQLQIYSNTEEAYKKFVQGLNEKKFESLPQKFQLADLAEKGLTLQQFTDFVNNDLQQKLTNKQCQLIFNKFDDDRNGSVDFDQFYTHVCRQINIPSNISYIIQEQQNKF